MTGGHYNNNGDPKLKYRTHALAQAAANRRGWYYAYRCRKYGCTAWHLSRRNEIKPTSPWFQAQTTRRQYELMLVEVGIRAVAVAEQERTQGIKAIRGRFVGATRRSAAAEWTPPRSKRGGTPRRAHSIW